MHATLKINSPMLEITPASEADFDHIWPIFRDIVSSGDTYVYRSQINRDEAKKVWMDPKFRTFIAKEDGKVVGAYVIRPNHRDLGYHIANAAYIVARPFQNKGIGRKMAEHSFDQARLAGYRAMQFNYVVSTNERAVKLWQSLGFEIIGTVPEGHQHQELGKLVPIHIMHRKL